MPGVAKVGVESEMHGIAIAVGARISMSSPEPDSPPRLSLATSALLQDFLTQRAEKQEDPFAENWNLSQVRPLSPTLLNSHQIALTRISVGV